MNKNLILAACGHDLIDPILSAAREAGELALGFFRAGTKTSAEVSHKDGGSPVTEADFLVDRFLKKRLRALAPEAGWLSEESEDSPSRLSKELVFIVDPIDGTRAFMTGRAGWSIAIALVKKGRPLVAVIHAPASGETYIAAEGEGARLNGQVIRVSKLASIDAKARVAAPFLLAKRLAQAGLSFDLQPKISSLALRFACVASGVIDVGFASQNAHDWDIAAADLILHEAGGRLASLDGRPIRYNRGDTRQGLLIAAPLQVYAQANAAANLANNIAVG